MLKAMIFDFDYTLGDSTDGIALSIHYALEKMGHAVPDRMDIQRTIGLSMDVYHYILTQKAIG